MVEDLAFVFGSHSAGSTEIKQRKKDLDKSSERMTVSRTAIHAMQKAVEKAGIQFIAKSGRETEGRLQK
jgi:hypothetical protein